MNGQTMRIPSQKLAASARLQAAIDTQRLFGDSPSRDSIFRLTKESILFESAFVYGPDVLKIL